MSLERSTKAAHTAFPFLAQYDYSYYYPLVPVIFGDVLDIGCGTGTFTREYAQKPEVKSIVAIDKYIDEMENFGNKTSIARMDIPYGLGIIGTFDTIVATEFIEHIPRHALDDLLFKIKRMLRPGGIFVGSTPNKVQPTVNEFHIQEYTLQELKDILSIHFRYYEAWETGCYCTVWKASGPIHTTRLHLGCGDMILPGFLNCDLYNPKAQILCDAMHLPFEDNSVESIYSAHLIEHFDFFQAYHLLEEWKRVLVLGGGLSVETPNLEALCKALVDAPEHTRFYLYDHFFGKPWLPGQTHKFLYTPTQLWGILSTTGFKNIVTVRAKRYIGIEHICLKMECTK